MTRAAVPSRFSRRAMLGGTAASLFAPRAAHAAPWVGDQLPDDLWIAAASRTGATAALAGRHLRKEPGRHIAPHADWLAGGTLLALAARRRIDWSWRVGDVLDGIEAFRADGRSLRLRDLRPGPEGCAWNKAERFLARLAAARLGGGAPDTMTLGTLAAWLGALAHVPRTEPGLLWHRDGQLLMLRPDRGEALMLSANRLDPSGLRRIADRFLKTTQTGAHAGTMTWKREGG